MGADLSRDLAREQGTAGAVHKRRALGRNVRDGVGQEDLTAQRVGSAAASPKGYSMFCT